MDNLHDDLIKLFLAIVLGGFLGAEREYRTKSAGFRTLVLVCVGSTLFTIFSIRIGGSNPDRIAANIITGIGFLGAGVIFRGENRVSGVTTATIIWMTAAVGMGIGSGEYIISTLSTICVLLVLIGFTALEKVIDANNQSRSYMIVCEYEQEGTLWHYEKLFEECGLKFRRQKQHRAGNDISGVWEVMGTNKNHEELTLRLLSDKKIKEFTF